MNTLRLGLAIMLWASQATASSPTQTALTLNNLKQKYQDLGALEAEIEQTKQSPQLKRALKSQVRLESANGTVKWQVLHPGQLTVIMDSMGIRLINKDGSQRKLPAQEGQSFAALFQMIQAMIRGDIAALERDFDLTIHERELVAVPKAGSKLGFMQSMSLHFDADLQLSELTIRTKDESTSMRFKSLKWWTASTPSPIPARPSP
jgi:outer membrane lipoprotein-sorting protein